jgi:nucleotide-binding universal stress UspA family protein
MELKKIVVAFDGSTDSARAVEVAAELGLKFGASLVVVHVYSSPFVAFTGPAGIPAPDIADLEDAAKDKGQATLDQGVAMAKRELAGASGELLEAASIVQAIVEFAADQKADLLVIGTRGNTGFKKLLLGSVSSGVVTHAACPVLVVR